MENNRLLQSVSLLVQHFGHCSEWDLDIKNHNINQVSFMTQLID